MQRLKERGCDLLFAVSWAPKQLRDTSPSIFRDLKFIEAAYIPKYWTEDSKEIDKETGEIKVKYMCPADGWPCRCPAIFFFKNA